MSERSPNSKRGRNANPKGPVLDQDPSAVDPNGVPDSSDSADRGASMEPARSADDVGSHEDADSDERRPEVSVVVKEMARHTPGESPSRPVVLKRRTRIKICGITSVDMALAAAEAGADAIGIVFVATSPRYVLPGPAQRIAGALPPLISSIGVFVNPSDPDLQNWRGQWVQMHGQEEEWQLARVAPNRRIIKGLKFDPEQVRRWERCPHVSAVLIEGIDHSSEQSRDYDRLAEITRNLSTPVILGGGLNPRNVEQAIRAVRPFGVDVSGGVESSRGNKEISLIREFCAAVRETDAAM